MAAKKTTPAEPAAEKADKGIHVVEAGETLADIAAKYRVGVTKLAARNNLRLGHRDLAPGQKIRLYDGP